MFLAAVARPRWDVSKNQWFNGKIGIWPFTYQEPAKRSSKNRAAGTMITKCIEAVNKVESLKMLINNLLPAIRNQWPRSPAMTAVIQQDNAKPHIDPSDSAFAEAASKLGVAVRLTCQPANSPDTNVLDLGFFNAIQSLQHQHGANSIDQLIAAVQTAFDALDRSALTKAFLTHQQCMIETMKVSGGNNYKLPHMGKDRLIRADSLPL